MAVSFSRFVQSQPGADSPEGELIASLTSLTKLHTWNDLRVSLRSRGADDAALIAARALWRRNQNLIRQDEI